ncbi:MAG TPA: cytochrome c, partial [Kofleriaceae bacterium]|nr:cytochrome c [Kofleriaceae bacterium]
QGWDSATRDAFYTTPQGSRMLPYSWFLHLEQASSDRPFRHPQNMRSMGFLVAEDASPSNPDNLPVGFARDVDLGRGDSFGLTCAACHTGELEYQGTKVRIDGGQAFADLEQLQHGILGSLQATLATAKKFERFSDKVLGTGASDAERAALRAEMEGMATWWQGRIARSAGLTAHGPSRIDAFTIIGNEVVCALFQNPSNCRPGVAPTQFPYLWDTPDFEWVQYNSSVHSPLGRNVGQVTGVFAEASFDQFGLSSSANIDNLHALENWLKALRSPAWPEEILGAIDGDLAAQGADLYASNCAGCHNPSPARTGPNAFGLTFARVDFSTPLFPAPDGTIPPGGLLGTDPLAAYSFATRRADPGPFTAIAQAQGIIGPDGKAPVAALLAISGGMIIQRFFAENGLSDLEKLGYLGYRESRSASIAQLTTYKARPLNGVAFTAPYLHNGSVPSMYELLLPPSQRSTAFYVGSKQYDPDTLGYSTDWEQGAVLLDTTQLGNGNGGHYYGTNLSDGERMALIEYIKTL